MNECSSGRKQRPESDSSSCAVFVRTEGARVRVRSGNHSYEIVPVRDPATLLLSHYKVVVVSEINGVETVMYQENAPSIERAKEIGETQLRAISSSEEQTPSSRVA